MKQLEQFFLLIDQCLNDTEFIRKHALSEKDFTHNRVLTFRNTFFRYFGASRNVQNALHLSFDAFIFYS